MTIPTGTPAPAQRTPGTPAPPGAVLSPHAPSERVSYDPGTDAAHLNITAQFPLGEVPVTTVDWLEVDDALFGMAVHLVEGRVGVVEVIGCRQLLGDDFCRRAVVGRGRDLVRVTEDGAATTIAFATDPASTVTPVADVARGGSARPAHLESDRLSADFEYHPNGTLRTAVLTLS